MLAGSAGLNLSILSTLVCWGIWGIFDKKALDLSPQAGVLFRMYVFSALQLPIVALILWTSEPTVHIPQQAWNWTLIGAITQFCAEVAYMGALRATEASFVLSLTAAYPLVTQLIAWQILGEPLVTSRVAGAAAIACGVALIGLTGEKHEQKVPAKKRLLLALCIVVATVCWGAWGIFDKKALDYGKALEVWFAQCTWEVIIAVVIAALLYLRGMRTELSNRGSWYYSGLSSLSLGVGRFTYLMAMSAASAAYVIAITGCYPMLMYLFALAFLKEKFSKLRLAGIAFVIIGGITVQMAGGH
jgi:drug/metabolite transporter (DMT)-like permease